MTDRAARSSPASAPGCLEVVQDFMNTLHVERGTDALADAAGTRAWLAGSGLAVRLDRLTRRDLARLAGLRDVLRALRGDPVAQGGAPSFADAVGATALTPRLGGDGRLRLTAGGTRVDEVVGTLLTAVLESQRDGTWDRLKVCRNEGCRWAFYDQSRSRTATWCAMGICGNRVKVAAHRRRHRTGGPGPDAP